jgi:hypothetical protein
VEKVPVLLRFTLQGFKDRGKITDDFEADTLNPGQKMEWEFNAVKFCEVGPPGKYTIQIRRPDPENPAIALNRTRSQ